MDTNQSRGQRLNELYVNVNVNINKQPMKMKSDCSNRAKLQIPQAISCGSEEDQATSLNYVETWKHIKTRAQFTRAVHDWKPIEPVQCVRGAKWPLIVFNPPRFPQHMHGSLAQCSDRHMAHQQTLSGSPASCHDA